MAATPNTPNPRPVFRNIHVFEIVGYKLPPAGWVSILHRISGALLFVAMPLLIWMFDASVTSEVSFDGFRQVFANPLMKLVALVLIWAYLHHFIAGVRHLWMDMTHSVERRQGRISALVTLALGLLLTLVLGVQLFI